MKIIIQITDVQRAPLGKQSSLIASAPIGAFLRLEGIRYGNSNNQTMREVRGNRPQ
jgi:hypothetical protein